MPAGFALTTATSIEIVTAYASSQTTVRAVEETPGWLALGAFFLPKSCSARLDVQMMVSDASLTCRVRLYDVTEDLALSAEDRVIPGAVASSSTTLVRKLGGRVSLKAGHTYQVQAEVTGDAGDEFFGAVPTVTISN